jgi:tRNA(fMet)-specific endonuclease VapC
MHYMLDTNIVSHAMRARPQAVLDRLSEHRPSQLCISAITHGELRFGAARSAARRRYDRLIDVFLGRVRVLPFDDEAAKAYGEVRASLEAKGERIGDLDMLIAGHAVATGRVLVTNNTREFGRVTGLELEDWSR